MDMDEAKEQAMAAFESGDGETIAEALAVIAQQIKDPDEIAYFSDLSEDDIQHLTVIETFDDEISRKLAEKYKKNRVSRKRKGRKEISDLVNGLGALNDQESGGVLSSMKGLLR